jgi:class 3 adenylate cyclase
MTVSFELYTLVKGRWEIHVRYEEGGRVDAMTEAQTLEKELHIERVRVVRDEYDLELNASQETVVYETVLAGDAQEKPGKGKKVLVGSSGGKREENKKTPKSIENRGTDLDALREKAQALRNSAQANAIALAASNAVSSVASSAVVTVTRARQLIGGHPNQTPLASGLLELAIVICISTLIALGVTVSVFYCLDAVHQSGVFSFQSYKTFWGLVIASFILTFASSFVPMIRKVSFTSNTRVAAQAHSGQMARELIQQVPQIVVAPHMAMQAFTEDAAEAVGKIKSEQPKEKQKFVKRTMNGPQHLKDASGWLLSYMTVGLKTIPTQMERLDPFNRFGLTLFFAGAGDFVGTRYRCDQKQRSDMLTERMELLGHDENIAFGFCANIDEYLMQPKYLKMYDLGRTAMKNFLDDQNADQKLEGALKDWNKPAGTVEEEVVSDFVVVLFTDIVDSIAQTQEIGDEGAMEVVHAHNQIIREALTIYKGKEVKHMGDGIMAVFQGVPNSVQAAIHMQNGIEAYCQTTTDRQFRCRIGINAGKPIRDGQDYFGTPVQLAARVMSKAESDEIAVSEIVQAMYSGKDVSFKKVGEFDLKGFDDPMAIFHVVYRQEQAVAAE